jgi:hypothetical protein
MKWAEAGMRTLVFSSRQNAEFEGRKKTTGDANSAASLLAKPAPGHQWLTTSAFDLRSEWKEGTPHPTFEHVVASKMSGRWRPAPGYKWRKSYDNKDYTVVWTPGLENRDFPGVVASQKEGKWSLERGYVWVTTSNDDLRARWSPGAPDEKHRHVVASIAEGMWHPAAGYDWVTKDAGNYEVKWIPGIRHPAFQNVISSDAEGKWHPAPGYSWKNALDDDLTVEFSAYAEKAFQDLTALSQRVPSDVFRQKLTSIVVAAKVKTSQPPAKMSLRDLMVDVAINCVFSSECRDWVKDAVVKADDWVNRQFRDFQPHPALDDVRDSGERAVRDAFDYKGDLEKPMIHDAPDHEIERAGEIA